MGDPMTCVKARKQTQRSSYSNCKVSCDNHLKININIVINAEMINAEKINAESRHVCHRLSDRC